MRHKTFRYLKTNFGLRPYLSACPYTDLENILELTCRVIPSVMITRLVSWEIVFDGRLSSHAVGYNMIGLPISFNLSPANVTSATCLP